MSYSWARQLDDKGKESIRKLLCWRVFLFLHWNILLPIFLSNSPVGVFSSVSHSFSLLYRAFVIIWLFLLAAYVSVPVGEEEQGPQGSSAERVYPKPAAKAAGYPDNSELVTLGRRTHSGPPPGDELVL